MLIPLLLAAPVLAHAPSLPAAESSRPSAQATEVVKIVTSDKLELQGDYFAPKASTDRLPGVLLVHDAGASRAQWLDMADTLRKKGFGVLAIDLRGHGGSATERYDWSKMSPEEHTKLWGLSTRDLEACALWMRERKELHSTNLNLVGLGRGCTLVVKHASRDENVRSLVLLDPPPKEQLGYDLEGDIHEIAGLPTYVTPSRGNRSYVERITASANAEAGVDFVELHLLGPRIETVLEDKKLPSDVAKWIAEKALPKRGRK